MTSNLLTLLAALGAGGIAGIAIGTFVVGGLIGLFGYRLYTKSKIGVAKKEAARILEEAKLEAANTRKEGILDAREQVNKMKADFVNTASTVLLGCHNSFGPLLILSKEIQSKSVFSSCNLSFTYQSVAP